MKLNLEQASSRLQLVLYLEGSESSDSYIIVSLEYTVHNMTTMIYLFAQYCLNFETCGTY